MCRSVLFSYQPCQPVFPLSGAADVAYYQDFKQLGNLSVLIQRSTKDMEHSPWWNFRSSFSKTVSHLQNSEGRERGMECSCCCTNLKICYLHENRVLLETAELFWRDHIFLETWSSSEELVQVFNYCEQVYSNVSFQENTSIFCDWILISSIS